jgi:hypothetical protein
MNLKFSIFFFAASVFFCPSFGQPESLKSPFKSIIITVGPFTSILVKIQKFLHNSGSSYSELPLNNFLKDGPSGIWVAERSRDTSNISEVYSSELVKRLYENILEHERERLNETDSLLKEAENLSVDDLLIDVAPPQFRKSKSPLPDKIGHLLVEHQKQLTKQYVVRQSLAQQKPNDVILAEALKRLGENYLPKKGGVSSQNLSESIAWSLLKTMFETMQVTEKFELVTYPYRDSNKSDELIIKVETVEPADALVIYGHHTAYTELLDNLISLNLTNGDGQRTPILLVVPGKFPSSKPKSSFQETLLSINAYITSLPNYLNNVKQKIDLITFSDATNLKIALHEWLRNIQ